MFKSIVMEIVESGMVENVEGLRLLDVGCGNGDLVQYFLDRGVDSYGTDVEFKEGKHLSGLKASSRILPIEISSVSRKGIIENGNALYVWPFKDRKFDVVVSRAVLEHVANIEEFVDQNRSALKKGGLAIHYFPSRWSVLEPHTGIPFGAVIRSRLYYRAMCSLGLCFKKYRRSSDVAMSYMENYTHYRNIKEIVDSFRRRGFELVGLRNDLLLKYYGNGKFYRFSKSHVLALLLGLFRSNVLILKRIQ